MRRVLLVGKSPNLSDFLFDTYYAVQGDFAKLSEKTFLNFFLLTTTEKGQEMPKISKNSSY